ncbi:MAG: glycosyltransferase family 4 protein [Methanomassiliicoccales archaeon]
MPKRIFIVAQNYPPDIIGGATRNVDMARLMSQFGSDVVVIANHPSYPFGRFKKCFRPFKRTVEDGITVYRIFTFQPNNAPAVISRVLYHLVYSLNAMLMALVLVKKDDVIITSIPPDTNVPVGLMVKKVVGCRWAMDVRDLWQEAAADLGFVSDRGMVFRAMTTFKKMAYQEVDVFGYVNDQIRDVLQNVYGATAPMVHHPNGADLSVFRPSSAEKECQLIYVSNFGYSNDVDQLLRTIKAIKDIPNFCLYVLGEGERRAEAEHAIKENEVKNVHLLGMVARNEIPGHLTRARAGLVLLNPQEAWNFAIPIKAIEYMAAGLPVVGIAGPGTRRFFEEHACGKLFAAENFSQLIDYLGQMDEREDELLEMGRKGRICAEQLFDKRTVTERFWKAVDQ